jgi:hypothetical protein
MKGADAKIQGRLLPAYNQVPKSMTLGRIQDGEPRRFVMSALIPLRQDFAASQLSGLARRSKDGPSGTRGTGSTQGGQADLYDELRARVVSWPPPRPARLR